MKSRQNPAKKNISGPLEVLLSTLRQSFSDDFTLAQAAELLSSSPRTALRRLQTLMESGYVQRTGNGPRTRYRVFSPYTNPSRERPRDITLTF